MKIEKQSDETLKKGIMVFTTFSFVSSFCFIVFLFVFVWTTNLIFLILSLVFVHLVNLSENQELCNKIILEIRGKKK